MERRTMIYWMRDLLDHLGQTYDQWAAGDGAESFLTDTIERDLDELRRLIRMLRGPAVERVPVRAK